MKKQASRRLPSKKITAIRASRHFRVVHSRHTGHVVHARNTSYPVLAMIVLCVGVFLTSWTRTVTADSGSYLVQVSVPGPAPTVPATINSPANNTQFSSVPITVNGNCPVGTYVTLFRNNVSSGVSICSVSGQWSVTTDLFVGSNRLIARDYSPTDVPGPDSQPTTVYYQPPQSPGTPNSSGGSPSSVNGSGTSTSGSGGTSNQSQPTSESVTEPLYLTSDYKYQGFYVGKVSTLQFSVGGGTEPYAIEIEWGDGTRDLISRPHATSVAVEHTYKKAGSYKGSYVVKISVSDGKGKQSFLQLLTIINNPPSKHIAGSASGGPNGGGGFSLLNSGDLGRLARYIWPSYGVTVLMLASFWLGERRELRYLKPRLKKIRHA